MLCYWRRGGGGGIKEDESGGCHHYGFGFYAGEILTKENLERGHVFIIEVQARQEFHRSLFHLLLT